MSTSENPQPKKGSSVLTILGGIAVVVMIACCGGGYYLYVKAKNAVENMAITDPAKIDEKRAEIVTIEIPANFKPKLASSIPGLDIQVVAYEATGTKPGSNGTLTISQASNQQLLEGKDAGKTPDVTAPKTATPKADSPKSEADKKDADEEDDEKGKKDEKKDEKKAPEEPVLTPPKEETKETTVNGEKATFKIVQTFDSDKKLESTTVVGKFRTKSKTYGMLNVTAPADILTAEQVTKLIESVK